MRLTDSIPTIPQAMQEREWTNSIHPTQNVQKVKLTDAKTDEAIPKRQCRANAYELPAINAIRKVQLKRIAHSNEGRAKSHSGG